MPGSFKIGKYGGVDVSVHWSWVIIFLLITWSFAEGILTIFDWTATQRWVAGGFISLVFFASLLMHELAHSWVARGRGVDVRGITLFLFGGVSNLKGEPKSAEDEFVIAIVGPLTSLGMGLVFAIGWAVLQFWNSGVAGISANLAVLNAVIAAFNLLPGFPLDGGRVFRSLLWWRKKNLLAATRTASRVGEYFSYGLMGVGVIFFLFGNLIGGIWLFVIGLFLRSASLGSYQQTLAQVTLAGMTAGQAARTDCEIVSPDTSLEQLVDGYILPRNVRCFPIQRDGQLLGLVTLEDVRRVPRDEWATTSVSKTMTAFDRLHAVSREEDLRRVVQIMSEEDVNQVPVVEGDRLVGLISRSDIMRLLKIRQDLAEEAQ
ncbi:MAG: site-2 protease family protein [Dehalococcoidia bacterium]|nr:site-2 protease family protein [Dehalococcoidia bacterium]